MPKIRKLLSSVLLLSLLLLVPAAGYCADTTTIAQHEKIEMSLTQYNQLQTIISEQEKTLITLQDRLNKLDDNSTVLQTQLSQAKEQLMKTKQSLTTANNSLSQASEVLNRQNESLMILTEQINEMTKKDARLKRQRDAWAVAAGMLLVGIAVK